MNHISSILYVCNLIDGVMVNRGFEPRSGQTNDYKIDICCCIFAKYGALRSKRRAKTGCHGIRIMCLEWSDRLLFQWAPTIKIKIQLSLFI